MQRLFKEAAAANKLKQQIAANVGGPQLLQTSGLRCAGVATQQQRQQNQQQKLQQQQQQQHQTLHYTLL